jgi:hypothetical protein
VIYSIFQLGNLSEPEELHTGCFFRPGFLTGAKNSSTIAQAVELLAISNSGPQQNLGGCH